MKKRQWFLFLLFFYACTGNEAGTQSENDVDAARNFINAALQGNYDAARGFMLNDSTNNQYLDAFEHNYKSRMSRQDKAAYREASINIHNVRALNDSVTIVQYSNSYKKKNDSLKILRKGNNWLVDLKYSFTKNDLLP